jgi:hypothetical protein
MALKIESKSALGSSSKQNTEVVVLIQLQSKAAVQEISQTKVETKIQYAHNRSVDVTTLN